MTASMQSTPPREPAEDEARATEADPSPRRPAPPEHPVRDTENAAAPRTGGPREQVKVWEEEGGSPAGEISSTRSTRPKSRPAPGTM